MNREHYWYILYVKGGCEEQLLSFFSNLNMYAFTPKLMKLHKKDGCFISVTLPMFPDHVFIKTDIEPDLFLNLLKKLKREYLDIFSMIYEGVQVLQGDEKDLLNRVMDEEHVVQLSTGIIEGGKTIVTDGPLIGLEQHIKKIDRHKRLALMDVAVLGHPLKMSLEITKKI